MKKKNKITGMGDGPNGRNESYLVNGKKISRKAAVKMAEDGKMPEHHIINKGKGSGKYLRRNPDHSKRDNVDYPREK